MKNGTITSEWSVKGYLLVRLEGTITGSLVKSEFLFVSSKLITRGGRSLVLIDGSKAKVGDPQLVKEVGKFFRNRKDIRRAAVGGASGAKAFFFSMLLKLNGPEYPMKGFKTVEEAENWLLFKREEDS